jgi:hypothetical protein
MNSIIKISIIILFFTSCVRQSDYHKINAFLDEKNIQITNYTQLVAINTLGDCLNCNNTFSLEMSKYLKQDSTLFIVSTPGAKIDISPYLTKKSSNIILDFRKEFNNLNIINHSSIFKFKENTIDTIIEFDVKNIDSCTKEIE